MVFDEGNVVICLVRWCIVLLQLPIVRPFARILEQSVALRNEMVTQYVSVLSPCHAFVRIFGLGVSVFADLLVSASNKLEGCGAMVADAHVHMSSNAVLGPGNSASCSLCAPSSCRSAHGLQFEILAVGDHGPQPRANFPSEGFSGKRDSIYLVTGSQHRHYPCSEVLQALLPQKSCHCAGAEFAA